MSDKPASPARGRKKTAPPAQQPPQEEVVVRLPLTDLYQAIKNDEGGLPI